jgi:hypothetical protein
VDQFEILAVEGHGFSPGCPRLKPFSTAPSFRRAESPALPPLRFQTDKRCEVKNANSGSDRLEKIATRFSIASAVASCSVVTGTILRNASHRDRVFSASLDEELNLPVVIQEDALFLVQPDVHLSFITLLRTLSHNVGMQAPTLDTLLLSDIHLGSDISRARDAVALLQSCNFRRLILLGDIFSDLNFAQSRWRAALQPHTEARYGQQALLPLSRSPEHTLPAAFHQGSCQRPGLCQGRRD